MATTTDPEALNELFNKIYRDAFSEGIGIFRTGLIDQMMKVERLPYDAVFRIRFRPFPGYSHAHSRKIRREARQLHGITVKLSTAWTYSAGN